MFASTAEFEARSPAGPRRRTGDRRTRARLRELCDEVLASYRVARGRDIISDDERREAKSLLKNVAPIK